jgi:hypothetical protein
MLTSAYGEECLSRTSFFEWHKRFESSSESKRIQKSWVQTMLTAFFYAKGIIHQEFVTKKKTGCKW